MESRDKANKFQKNMNLERPSTNSDTLEIVKKT